MDHAALADRLEFAQRIARRAGNLIMQYYATDFAVERKSDDSPVTIADREAELELRRAIESEYPADAILGEEFGAKTGTSPYRWILDPIDGTKSFIAGVPLFGTLIGIQADDQSVIGVMEFPGLNRRISACLGMGAWWQTGDQPPLPAHVSTCHVLRDALYVTTDIASFSERGAKQAHDELAQAAWYSRTWGDCYGYFLVATGRAAVMVDPIVNLWDAAALLPILKEAGGSFTDWSGRETVEAGEAIATNGHVLGEVLEITRRYRRSTS